MPDALRLALTTLTVARVRPPRRVDAAGRAMELAPLVGLLLGLAAAGVLYVFRVLGDFRSPPLLAAALAIASLALLTRGLHLDGLADVADGLGSYRDPEGTRAVMKAPDIGPMGVATIALVLLVQVSAVLSCIQHGRGSASLVLAVATGRLAITWGCTVLPPATPDGLGALVARTARWPVALAWTVLLTAAFSAYAVIDTDSLGSDTEQVVRTAASVVVALLVTAALARHVVRRVGGLTGDVLGALSEVATTVCLVGLASGVWGS